MGSPSRHTFDAASEHILRLMATFKTLGRPASTTEIADIVGTSPSTITTALKRLAEQGYINYSPYKSPTLTEKGVRLGRRVSRKHELVEKMLIKFLGMDWAEAHWEAHRLEHAVSENLARIIEKALGKPAREESDARPTKTRALLSCEPEERARVVSIVDESHLLSRELQSVGLVPGALLLVKGRSALSRAVVVQVSGHEVPVDEEVAARITVQTLEDSS
jgi:DtxR family Mn-dependent transcriptional regulator